MSAFASDLYLRANFPPPANDCNGGHSLAQMTSDMNDLLNATYATSPSSHVFLADTIPTGQPWNACISTWSAAVPGLVAQWAARGMTITFVPMNAEVRMCGASGDDYDLCGGHQIHPTSAGYPRMASAFALTIMKHFNRTAAALPAPAPPRKAPASGFPRTVLLKNAADANVSMPMAGLGTAGGGTDHGYGVHPECWASCLDAQCLQPNPAGCAAYTEKAIAQWFSLGGRRLDSANGYRNQNAVGAAISAAIAPGQPLKRSDVFLVTKIGSYLPMGYGETWNETAIILKTTGLEYIDNLMMHWPSCETGGGCGPSSDPLCDWGSPTYDDRGCRVSTWRALVDIWKAGLARSVGVCNFNVTHLEDLRSAGLPLPSTNQVSFYLYHTQAEKDLLAYCNANGINMQSWVPFARTDSWVQQPPCAVNPVLDPAAAAMAAKYGVSSAQLQLAFQVSLGISVNPRSQSVAHMQENLDIFDVNITAADMNTLWTGFPQSICEPPACTNPVVAGKNTCVNNGK